MAAPPKPWERGGGQNMGSFFVSADTGRAPINQHSTSSLPLSGSSTVPSINRAPPPLPTRPSQQGSLVNRYGGFGSGYGSGYNGYGSGFGGYGSGFGSMYGGYYGGGGGGLYGGGMYGGGGYFGQNQFGSGTGFNQFLQRAEENSRPAFQSIESIVQAFGSVSMMMESTLQTVYNSFRAVLGVADHFSRLKVHLAHIFTALALFRTLRYLYRRILVILGLRNREFAEELWEKAQAGEASELEKLGSKTKPGAPSWPIFMFFAVVVGGPYIIWKLLCSTENDQDKPGWASGEDDHVVARAEFDFDAEGNNELSFKAGVMMNLAPKELQPKVRGWVLASVNGQTTGLVPANYIKILGRRHGQKRTMDESKELASKQENIADTTPQVSENQSAASSLQATRSETNLAAFDKAFAEAPDATRPTEGGMQASLDSQWAEWEKEGTSLEAQMVASDKADMIDRANHEKS